MKKNKVIITKTPKELAKTLGLTPTAAIEWKVRNIITKKIIESTKKHHFTVTEIAKNSGTSRARITRILKDNTLGISLDVLVRVLSAVGEEIQIRFKSAA